MNLFLTNPTLQPLPPAPPPPPPPPASTLNDIAAFQSLLYRDANQLHLAAECRRLLQQYANDVSSLHALFQVIRYTRETLLERDLTYLQLWVWYEFHPVCAAHALVECVSNYGCWKDIQYFCQFCKNQQPQLQQQLQPHPFVLYAICVLEHQLKQDWFAYQHYQQHGNWPWPISNAAKWTPREKSAHGWIYTMLSVGYFDYFVSARTLDQQTSALKKSKMHLRKILSTLNKHLDTVEIKQCANDWNNIDPVQVPIHATFKYHRAFYRHGVPVRPIRDQAANYPYANVKRLADRVNQACELDESLLDIGRTPADESLQEHAYRDNLNGLVSRFLGTSSGRALGLLDIATLTPHDVNEAIGCCGVECDGVLLLHPTGKYQLLVFSSTEFCRRIKELTTQMAAVGVAAGTPSPDSPPPASSVTNLQTVRMFLERCFAEAEMTEAEREKLTILVFSRHPLTELKEIFVNERFQLKL